MEQFIPRKHSPEKISDLTSKLNQANALRYCDKTTSEPNIKLLKLLLLTESKLRVENSTHRVRFPCRMLEAHTRSANILSVKNQHFVWLAGSLTKRDAADPEHTRKSNQNNQL